MRKLSHSGHARRHCDTAGARKLLDCGPLQADTINYSYLFPLDRYDSRLAQLAKTCRYGLAIYAQSFGYVLVRDASNAIIVQPLNTGASRKAAK